MRSSGIRPAQLATLELLLSIVYGTVYSTVHNVVYCAVFSVKCSVHYSVEQCVLNFIGTREGVGSQFSQKV